jgi:type IV pilus assembly protein PilY1
VITQADRADPEEQRRPRQTAETDIMNTCTGVKKLSVTLGLSLLLMSLGQNNARALTLPDVPLSVFSTVEHNVLLTFDDSGSMTWGFLPDTISGNSATKRACSSAFNGMAYNPSVTYTPPPVVNNPGNLKDTTPPQNLPDASFTGAWINGYSPTAVVVDLSTSYKPVWGMNSTLTANTTIYFGSAYASCSLAPTGGSGVAAFYYVYDTALAGTGGCPSTPVTTDDDCYRLVQHNNPAALGVGSNPITGEWSAAQQTNFANWYSYYRVRNLAAKAAAGRAFRGFDTNVRVAGHLLNNSSTTAGPASGITFTRTTSTNTTNVLKRFCDDPASTDSLCKDGTTARQDFFTRLYNTPAASGTPLPLAMQRAGNSFGSGNTGQYSPYRDVPGDSVSASNPELSCRKNFHIMMTDGYWNGTLGVSGNKDGSSQTLGDGTTYAPIAPYSDGWSSTLADNAFYYWYNDLRTDLGNNVLASESDPTGTAAQRYWNPANNPATWQHMQTFTIGMGITGTRNPANYFDTSLPASAGDWDELQSGGLGWPNPMDAENGDRIDDLWHAAINGRGKYFSARDPDALVSAFTQIIGQINAINGSAAGLGASGSTTSGGTAIFQSAYDTGTWAGRLISRALDVNGDPVSVNWEAGTAGLNTQNYNDRKILTYNPTNAAGAPFRWGNLTTAQQTALNTNSLNVADTYGDERLDYLRGASTNEGAGLGFRVRTCYNPATAAASTPSAITCPADVGKLGDIIDSSPVYVGKLDFGYPDTLESGGDYSTHVTDWANREKIVYVGANDGMLHGFRASDGMEVIAYVPNLVYSNISQNNLGLLASPFYSHRFYVNATPTVGDAFINGDWRTMLVGGLRKGGKGYYALDITDPSSFLESNAAQIAKWEFTDPDLGYSYSQAAIVKMASGQWAAIFGNGYNNTGTGRAMLYIVDMADGSLIRKIDTGVSGGGGTVANPNGMATPAVVDMNNDHIADYIYAGDLLGKMWRIDVRSSTASDWALAANIHPLFTAVDTLNDPQPITTKPSVGFHPEGFGGAMIYFGTGKFLENFDNSATGVQQRQTFYAIYDRGVTGRSTEPSKKEATPIVRADLLQQTITAGSPVTNTVTGDVFNTRNISDNPINWRLDRSSTTTHLGWYVNLPESGEKQVTDSLLREGRIIFTTLSPGIDACEPGGSGWLMELNTKNGGRLDQTLDLNGDGVFDSADNSGLAYGAAGAQLTNGGSLSSPIVLPNPSSQPPSETKLSSKSKGGTLSLKESRKPNAPQSWRQLK